MKGKFGTVDEYIASTEGTFAHPVLQRTAELIREHVPHLEEKVKWGVPSFEYKGLMVGMIAFKGHVGIWFHKGALLTDPHDLLEASSEETKSLRKYQVKNIAGLDEEGLKALIVEAVRVNEEGGQVEGYNRRSDKYEHSDLLNKALENNTLATRNFFDLSAFKRREYIEYIETAKRQDTREKRVEKAVRMIEQGIGLNDKYRK